MTGIIYQSLDEASKTLQGFISDPLNIRQIEAAATLMSEALANGGKIISCGNGGSLCDATHFAEELTGRYRGNRIALPAIAINDPAYITCVANDFSFEEVFLRFVEAFGRKEDVLLAISTSGNSANVIGAVKKAQELGMKVIGLTATGGNQLSTLADIVVAAPGSAYSDRIQEIHIKVIHILVQSIELNLKLSK